MQVISKEICALTSSVAIIYRKVGATRPLIIAYVILAWRLQYVQYDWDSIFVVVSYKTLVRVSSIGSDQTVPFQRVLSRLMVWNYDLMCWLQWKLRWFLLSTEYNRLSCGVSCRVALYFSHYFQFRLVGVLWWQRSMFKDKRWFLVNLTETRRIHLWTWGVQDWILFFTF